LRRLRVYADCEFYGWIKNRRIEGYTLHFESDPYFHFFATLTVFRDLSYELAVYLDRDLEFTHSTYGKNIFAFYEGEVRGKVKPKQNFSNLPENFSWLVPSQNTKLKLVNSINLAMCS
jgi:hypothetical protein